MGLEVLGLSFVAIRNLLSKKRKPLKVIWRWIRPKFNRFRRNNSITIFKGGKSDNARNKSIFKLERPLDNINLDSLGRKEFVERLGNEINRSFFPEAFSIGIVAKWASGKSTFIQFIKQCIDKDNRVIIEFQPWLSQDSKSITKSFLNLVKLKLNKYDKNFKPTLDKYYKTLAKVDGGTITKIARAIETNFVTESTVKQEFDRVNEGLRRLNKQIVILIDDLDRLDDSEIIEVFKLIRNTANFWNTIYITAFDRSYVTNAVRNFNEYNPHIFVDKIFDFEYILPEFDTQFVIEELNKLITSHLSFSHIIYPSTKEAEFLSYFVKDRRELNRFKSFLYINSR